jgi:polar amino acid transport system substrate-binding protein
MPRIITASVFLLLGACATMPSIPPAVRSDLAPTGTLRAGINHGNTVLAQRDPATGELRGVAVDLTRELGRRLGVPVQLVPYGTAGAMTDALTTGVWDIAFLAAAPFQRVEDVDRPGVRIAVASKSAYELYLTRNVQHAELVRAASGDAGLDLVVAGKADVLAGVRQLLVAAAPRLPGARVMAGHFMTINQAMGVPKGRDAGLSYAREFIEDAKASGFVTRSLEKSGQGNVPVAPAAPIR